MSAYRHGPDVLWHRTSRRVLVSPGPGASNLELDGVSALVWDALAEPVTVAELAADLAAVFDRPVAEVAPQVEQIVADLTAAGAACPN